MKKNVYEVNFEYARKNEFHSYIERINREYTVATLEDAIRLYVSCVKVAKEMRDEDDGEQFEIGVWHYDDAGKLENMFIAYSTYADKWEIS